MQFIFAEDVPSALSREDCGQLAELCSNKRCLEVGAQFGRSTIAIASVASIIHSVDWHRGDKHAGHCETLEIFTANLKKYEVRDKVVVHVGRNEEVLPAFKLNLFDTVFLDSSHDKASVERDISLIHPLVKPGGTIIFHDYGINPGPPNPFGVTEAVDEFEELNQYRKKIFGAMAIVQLLKKT